MKIQGKDFPDGELVVYTNYSRSEHTGAGGCFQVVDILIDEEKSILSDLKIDVGVHYFSLEKLRQDLEIFQDAICIKEVIV